MFTLLTEVFLVEISVVFHTGGHLTLSLLKEDIIILENMDNSQQKYIMGRRFPLRITVLTGDWIFPKPF